LYKYPCNNFSLFKTFLKSKFIRLIPLYWFALVVNYIIFIILRWDISYPDVSVPKTRVKIIFQIFTMQSLTSIETFYAMWFVAALVLFILLYGIIAYLTKDRLILIILSLLLYIPLDILTTRNVLIPSILFYYPIFIAGIFAGRFYLSSKEIKPIIKGLPRWVKYCSYSSYAVYLFHFSVYVVLNVFFTYFGVSNDILLILLGIPLSFTIGYLAQKVYDNSVGKWLNLYLSRGAN
jgi:peptidoglycan/LPS O-acetylase OafA/YrhL